MTSTAAIASNVFRMTNEFLFSMTGRTDGGADGCSALPSCQDDSSGKVCGTELIPFYDTGFVPADALLGFPTPSVSRIGVRNGRIQQIVTTASERRSRRK